MLLAAAWQLRDRGFTVAPNVKLPERLVTAAREEALVRFDSLSSDVARLGVHPLSRCYLFSEIATRQKNRFDMRLPSMAREDGTLHESPALAELCQTAAELAAPVIEQVHTELPLRRDDSWRAARRLSPARPRLDSTGVILSQPSASAQRFHADASRRHFALASVLPRHRLYNVFVPLVDIAANTCGTQFWPGSHLERSRVRRYRKVVSRSGHVEDDAVAMREMEAPACPAGSMLIFDYRVLHRGLANEGHDAAPRPIAYAVCSTGWAKDDANFPQRSLRAAVATLPTTPEELSRVQGAISEQFPLWEAVPERETDPHARSADTVETV